MKVPIIELPHDTQFPYITSDRSAVGFTDGELVVKNGGGPVVPIVSSNIQGVTGATSITNIVAITQSDYDNIAEPDANTVYLIKEEEA